LRYQPKVCFVRIDFPPQRLKLSLMHSPLPLARSHPCGGSSCGLLSGRGGEEEGSSGHWMNDEQLPLVVGVGITNKYIFRLGVL
jgi:hypothetical protein